jgi:hypothetical protein
VEATGSWKQFENKFYEESKYSLWMDNVFIDVYLSSLKTWVSLTVKLLFWSDCCLIEKTRSFLCAVMGLFWVTFIEQVLEGFLDASANVTFRLPKARRQACSSYCQMR